MMKLWFMVAFIFCHCGILFAQDYSFEIPQKEAKEERLELGGYLDGKYSVFHSRQSSPFYQLQFFDQGNLSQYLTQYMLELYLNGDYQTKDIGFHLKTYSTYDNDSAADFHLLEGYGNFNLSLSSFVQAGKRMYNWGKGYAFNPVGYVNPFKDPENPELEQAGIMSLSFEAIKNFNSNALKTTALTVIVVPPAEKINNRYAEIKNTDIAGKIYSLLWNIDVDVMGYYSKVNPIRFGADFSTNIRENIEAHGEMSYSKDATKNIIINKKPATMVQDAYSYLLGFRYLNRWNTTIIAEYYHNGIGLDKAEYTEYIDFLQHSIDSANQSAIKQALGYSQGYFKGVTLMQDYLYLKINQPEPFNWLYFTPSVFVIYNLKDRSLLLATPLSYKPFTNSEFIFWPTFLIGSDGTEFGNKQFQQRLELRMQTYF